MQDQILQEAKAVFVRNSDSPISLDHPFDGPLHEVWRTKVLMSAGKNMAIRRVDTSRELMGNGVGEAQNFRRELFSEPGNSITNKSARTRANMFM